MHDAALNLTVLDRRGQPIGLLRLYGLNNRDLTARMSVMMAPTAHATGTGLIASGQLIDEAFAAFPIRKIYVEAAAAALSLYHRGTVEIIQIEGQQSLINGMGRCSRMSSSAPYIASDGWGAPFAVD